MATVVNRDEAMKEVVDILSPFIGASLARASVAVHVQKLNLGASMTAEELESFLNRLSTGIRVFVGNDKAAALVSRIQRAVMGDES